MIVLCTFNNVLVFNHTNFKTWKNKVTLVLACMDLDYALREQRLIHPIDQSSVKNWRTFGRWEMSNHIGLMIMKNVVMKVFLDIVSKQ